MAHSPSPSDVSAGPEPLEGDPIVCRAIRELRILEFTYKGLARVVKPYVHGWSRDGAEALRAVQVGGSGSSSDSGKLWKLRLATGLRLTDRAFVPDDPRYNPDDTAMARIHCRAERVRRG